MIRSKKDLEKIVRTSDSGDWKKSFNYGKYDSGTSFLSNSYSTTLGRGRLVIEERSLNYVSHADTHDISADPHPRLIKYKVKINGKVKFVEEYGEGFIEGLYIQIDEAQKKKK